MFVTMRVTEMGSVRVFFEPNQTDSGVARGRAIEQLPNNSKVIARGFF
jgi:hypothetical protein